MSSANPWEQSESSRGYTDPNTRGDTTASPYTPPSAVDPAPVGNPGGQGLALNDPSLFRFTGLPAGVGAPPTTPPQAQSPNLAGSAAPGPTSAPATPGFWQGTNPWAQNVTATQNGQTQNWATPGNPNTNYVTPEAATRLGQTFGANVVSQNLNGMASPGSGAPSAPMYGLDFGYGDVQDAGMGAFQLARGDSQDLVRQRYQAGLNNTGWGGPAPGAASPANDIFWNRTTPISQSPQQASMAPTGRAPFGNAQFQRNLTQGLNPGPTVDTGTPPQANGQANGQGSLQSGPAGFQQVMTLLSQLLGPQQLSALMAQLMGQGQSPQGQTTRRAPLTQARNTSLQRNYFYPNTEPRLY